MKGWQHLSCSFPVQEIISVDHQVVTGDSVTHCVTAKCEIDPIVRTCASACSPSYTGRSDVTISAYPRWRGQISCPVASEFYS